MGVPKGVSRHEHTAKSSKAKRHPAAVNPGMSHNRKVGGSSQPVKANTGGSAAAIPSGVRERDGATNMGAKTMHKTGKGVGGAPGGRSVKDMLPSDVRTFNGTSVPKRIR